jgi:hypothetical protein
MRRLSRKTWRWIFLGAAVAIVVILGSLWRSAIRRNRSIPDEPFQIAGNLYYVGSTGVTSFLLTGPEGHVVIDGGYPETAPLESYPGIRSAFERSFQTLRDLPADIFLGSHGSFFDLYRKRGERANAKDPVAPFIDREGYLRYIDNAEKRFRSEIADQRK